MKLWLVVMFRYNGKVTLYGCDAASDSRIRIVSESECICRYRNAWYDARILAMLRTKKEAFEFRQTAKTAFTFQRQRGSRVRKPEKVLSVKEGASGPSSEPPTEVLRRPTSEPPIAASAVNLSLRRKSEKAKTLAQLWLEHAYGEADLFVQIRFAPSILRVDKPSEVVVETTDSNDHDPACMLDPASLEWGTTFHKMVSQENELEDWSKCDTSPAIEPTAFTVHQM